MIDKVALDRYLTTEPDDDFTPWCEYVANYYSHKFIEEFDKYELENKWLNYLFDKSYEPQEASLLIEKTYYRFIKK